MAEVLARRIVESPVACLVLVVAVTALAAVSAVGLGFDSSYYTMLPRDEPRIVEADAVRARTGGQRQLVVAISGGDRATRAAFGRALSERIEPLPQIRWVDAALPVAWFDDRALWLLDEGRLEDLVDAVGEALDLEAAAHHPLGLSLADDASREEAWARVEQIARPADGTLHQARLESRDGRYTFVIVTPTVPVMDFAGTRAMFAGIDEAVERLRVVHPEIAVRYAGKFQLARDQHAVLSADLRRASVLALVLCILVIAAFTRTFSAPVFVGVGVVLGLVWTLGVARVLVGSLNLISAFLIPVLIGLGADFGIHLVTRFLVERRTRSKEDALRETIRALLPPSLIGALTTSATFLVLTVSDFAGFYQLGLVTAVGVMLTFVVSFLAIPPMLAFVDPRPRSEVCAPRLATWAAPIVVVALTAWALYGAASIGRIHFDNDYRRLRTDSDELEFFEYVDDNLGFRFDPTIVVVDPEHVATVHRVIDALRAGRADDPVERVFSIQELLPRPSERRAELFAALDRLLARRAYDHLDGDRARSIARARERTAQPPWDADAIPASIRRRLTTLDGEGAIVLFWPKVSITSDVAAWAWAAELDEIRAQLDAEGVEHLMATETLTPSWVHALIVADAPSLIGLASIVVFLITALLMRSIRGTLLVCVPLVIAVLGALGVMAAFHLNLDLFNLIVLPCVLGIGIDNLVHLVHRFERAGAGSMARVMRETGLTVALTSITTAIGFGSMLVAHHAGLRSLGTLALIAIGFTLAAAALYLPALVTWLDRRRVSA